MSKVQVKSFKKTFGGVSFWQTKKSAEAGTIFLDNLWIIVFEITALWVKSLKKIPYSVLFVICCRKEHYLIKDVGWSWQFWRQQQPNWNPRKISSSLKEISKTIIFEKAILNIHLRPHISKGSLELEQKSNFIQKKQQRQKKNNSNKKQW